MEWLNGQLISFKQIFKNSIFCYTPSKSSINILALTIFQSMIKILNYVHYVK